MDNNNDDDDDDDIENLFKKVAIESEQAMAKIAASMSTHKNNNNNNTDKTTVFDQQQEEQQSRANFIRLREVCLLKKWDNIKPDQLREKVQKEQNVIRTHYITEAELQVPFELREETTARFFLYILKQEGLFNDIYDMEVFTMESTKQQFLLCSTLSRRIDVRCILTGDYVFQLVNSSKVWNPDNMEEKMQFVDGVCKMAHEGPKILGEKVIFRNFYFNILNHPASDPILELNFL